MEIGGPQICGEGYSRAPQWALWPVNQSGRLWQTRRTATPIKHLIIIIGENRSFDHLFATYKPVPGNTVLNLLSEGIVRADGTPGPNYRKALQYSATDTSVYELKPPSTPYTVLPPALVGGTKYPYACQILGATSTGTYATGTSCVTPANSRRWRLTRTDWSRLTYICC